MKLASPCSRRSGLSRRLKARQVQEVRLEPGSNRRSQASGRLGGRRSVRRLGVRHRAAFAACGWSVLFAVPHVYWAAGGTAGLPNGEPLRGPVAAINVAAIGLSGFAAILALALVRPWGAAVPRRLLLAGAWGACALLGLRGAGGLAQGILEDGAWSDEGSDALVIGSRPSSYSAESCSASPRSSMRAARESLRLGRGIASRAGGECSQRPP